LAQKFAPGEFFRDDKFAWSEFGRAPARPKGARHGGRASKTKSVIFVFLHFSITEVIEKWRHVPVLREPLT
jgi:hypothetical protein